MGKTRSWEPPIAPTENTCKGSLAPFTSTRYSASMRSGAATACTVDSAARISPPTVNASMRAARFTAAPTTPYFARCCEPIVPATTSPLQSPRPISSSGSPWAALVWFTLSMASCMASAQARAASAWSWR